MDEAIAALELDRAMVERVAAALEDLTVQVATCRLDPIVPPVRSAVTAGLFRVRGTADSRQRMRGWSAVLKVIRPPEEAPDRDRPHATGSWKREALVYTSGLLEQLPPGFAAPRCYGVMPAPEGALLLWLEDVPDRFGPRRRPRDRASGR